MGLNNVLLCVFFLSIINVQTNAMEEIVIPEKIENFTGFIFDKNTSTKDILRHGKYLLEMNHLTAFIAHAEKFNLNPNHFKTHDGYTPLMIACEIDFKGDLIQRLLDWGDIYMARDRFGVLVCLQLAIEVNNYYAVLNLYRSGSIFINEKDRVVIDKFWKNYKRMQERRRSASLD